MTRVVLMADDPDPRTELKLLPQLHRGDLFSGDPWGGVWRLFGGHEPSAAYQLGFIHLLESSVPPHWLLCPAVPGGCGALCSGIHTAALCSGSPRTYRRTLCWLLGVDGVCQAPCHVVCESASENTDYLMVLEVSPSLPFWEWVGWALPPHFWSHPMGGEAPLIRHFLFCQSLWGGGSLIREELRAVPTQDLRSGTHSPPSLRRPPPLGAQFSDCLPWKVTFGLPLATSFHFSIS